jgi:tRNA G10  N-methylase Trm11
VKQYIFQFGRFPHLSQAELLWSALKAKDISSLSSGFFRVSGENITNPQIFFDQLGGSIRMADPIPLKGQKFSDAITEYITLNSSKKKVQYGLSVFPERAFLLRKVASEVKQKLKKNGYSVRYINRENRNLDAGTLHKEGVFQKEGKIEFLLFPGKRNPILAKTIAAQNGEEFAKRDYYKPLRDMKTGMLPPKIALMLLHFASTNGMFPQHIWDPFCGTGSINIEAERLGISNMGSDISPKMIKFSQKNFFHFFKKSGDFFVHDATHLLSERDDFPIKIIVSEGYLGPIFSSPISEKQYETALCSVEPIIKGFFQEIQKRNDVSKMVFCFPFWKKENGKDGFCETSLVEAKKYWRVSPLLSKHSVRGSLLYRRENQIIGREIFVFER